MSFYTDSPDGAAVRTSLSQPRSTPKRFQIEMPFAPPPCDRAMLDAHFLSAVADLVIFRPCSLSTNIKARPIFQEKPTVTVDLRASCLFRVCNLLVDGLSRLFELQLVYGAVESNKFNASRLSRVS